MCMCGCEDTMRIRYNNHVGGHMSWFSDNWHWISYIMTFLGGWAVAAYVYH